MTFAAPVRFDANSETRRDDEADTVRDLNASFDHILETTRRDYGHAVRAVHAKAHGVLKGEFTVDGGLPTELAQGLFLDARSYLAVVRLSTNAGDILDDSIALPRGLALKIIGVDGERLPGAEGSSQDFVMVDSPVFAAPNAKKFAGNLRLLSKTTDKAQGAKIALSKLLQTLNGALTAVGHPSTKLASLGGAPQVDPLGQTYFSVTPFLYGDFIAKFRLRPVSPSLRSLTGKKIDTHEDPNAIRSTVQMEMSSLTGEWAFEVQLCRDLEKQPIEDATAEWKEEEAPFAKVATLRLGPQNSWSPDLVHEVDEGLRFSIWTGLKAHQPLGDVNRARRETYQRSADFRATANNCPILEP